VPVVGGHVAPAEEALPFLLDALLDDLLAVPARVGVMGQKNNAHAVLLGRGRRTPRAPISRRKKASGSLQQDARAVAGFGVAAAGAPMTRLSSTCKPISTIRWDRSPLMWATKPTPHASCSKSGLYRPPDVCRAVALVGMVSSGFAGKIDCGMNAALLLLAYLNLLACRPRLVAAGRVGLTGKGGTIAAGSRAARRRGTAGNVARARTAGRGSFRARADSSAFGSVRHQPWCRVKTQMPRRKTRR
jgi:hypothetical protein